MCYVTLRILASAELKIDGLLALFFMGLAHSLAMTSMSVAFQ
jgi:hypothetical protein